MIKAPKFDELTENDIMRRTRLNQAIQILNHNVWFEYKKALEIFDEFDVAYLQACKYYENPGENADIRPISLFLSGEINTGKTTLVVKYMNYCEQIAKREKGTYSENDVLYFDTPVHASFKYMFSYMLERLNINNQGKNIKEMHTDRLIDLIIKELRKRKVKVLFLDEIQNLVKITVDEKEDIFNGFKKLANQSQTRLILVGTPSSMDLFKDAKWVDERYRVLLLPKWDITKEYLDLLFSIHQAYEDFLPDWDLVDKAGMVNKDIALYLHNLSDGRLGKLIQTIRYAAVRALSQNRTNVTVEDYDYVQPIKYSVKDGKIIESLIPRDET